MKSALGQTAIGLALCFAALGILRGQQAEEPRLLDFTVVAVDSHGNPVTGLTTDDFEVVDQGKRQQIAYFHPYRGKAFQIPSTAPGEFSNRGPNTNQHVTYVLFDLLNERFATKGVTANQLVRDLQKIETPDGLYLYVLTVQGRIFAVHGLIQPGVETSEPGDAPWTKNIKPLLDGALKTVTTIRPVDIDVNVRVGLTLQALDTIANQLASFPGRKNLVWVTDGVPLALGPRRSDTGDFVDFSPLVRQLSEVFDRAETAIYPVQQIMVGSPNAMDGGNGIESRATLDDLAGLTGGRPTGSKDIAPAITQAMNDSVATYRIGYFASASNWDSKFHKLKITCRRKDVRLQARTGYYAWPQPINDRAQRAINTAITAANDAAEIGVVGSLKPAPKDPSRVEISVRINGNDIALPQEGTSYSGQLRVALAGYTPDGKVSASPLAPIDLHFTAAERDQALKDGVPVTQELALAKDVSKVRFIVFDRDSGLIGSLSIPVQPASLR